MVVHPLQLSHRDVSPLELFFDLVFVFAVSQLTHHLVAALTWRGAGETLVMLVAVMGVWAFTSFEVTLLDAERAGTKAVIVTVMGLALLMNAGVAHAFKQSPWLFVVPMVLALVGPGCYATMAAPTREMRGHFARVLVWVTASGALWVNGASLGPRSRIWWWSAAALIDLVGTWTAHPTPGRVTQTARLPFDADHMLERMRLFLIILLGETVLALGQVVSEHKSDGRTLAMVVGSFIALVCLWATYFGGAEQVVATHISETKDPVRAVHRGINVLYGVFAGLVLTSAGSGLVLAHASDVRAGAAGVVLLLGPAAYLLAQAAYFSLETATGWAPRATTSGVLAAGAVFAYWLPGYLVVTLLTACLLVLTAVLTRQKPPHRSLPESHPVGQ